MRTSVAVVSLCLLAMPMPGLLASVATTSRAQDDGHPFAEHRLVLQLSDNDERKQRLVISIANNLLAHFGPDKIAVEVVTFGPGIHLLVADSPNRARVDSLISQGVRFDVCMNTVETIARESGSAPKLNPNATPVQVGVAHILTLTERGYTLVRP